MVEYDELFSMLSACFAPVERDEWEQLTDQALWAEFLEALHGALQGTAFAASDSCAAAVGFAEELSLQAFLSEYEALSVPPTYDEKRAFAARHFTGGLPESAMPVESLYTTWSNGSQPSPFSKGASMYQGDSARYLRDLVERLGLEVPPQFAGYPDHLALELDLIAVLLRSNAHAEARQFAVERLGWLAAYRTRLMELGDSARFYRELVEVLVGIHAQLEAVTTSPTTPPTATSEQTEVTQGFASNTHRSHACI